MDNATTIICDLNNNLAIFTPRGDMKCPILFLGECADTVIDQVQKHLHETWAVSPNKHQTGLHGPFGNNFLFLQ
jgi:hypothetical protein